ncbi:MAG: mannonate dehydratase [Opitutales bacterium]
MRTLKEGFRWYGDSDVVSLAYIRQSGAKSVYSSLHHIPYGEVWSVEEIQKHQAKAAAYNLEWDVVESVPVSEDIKLRQGDYLRHIENYKQTIVNLAKCGIKNIIYNFMPVLDWIRTDLHFELEDGSKCLKFDPVHFAAFDIFLLQRKNAENEHSKEIVEKAKVFFDSLNAEQRETFQNAIIDVFPGCKMGLSIQDVRNMLAKYDGIDAKKLKEHLYLFLAEVLPVAEAEGAILAIHPDDPPFDVLGLPRIASRLADFQELFTNCNSPANTICFCTGSLSASKKNNLPEMLDALKDRVYIAHLRSTQINEDGSFFESGHLEGGVPMAKVVTKLLGIQKDRQEPIVFRPDHGRDIADDLSKPPTANPGYSFIGRMKGLAEIRGLQQGIIASKEI